MNRSDIVHKLKELNFPLSSVIGVAELRGKGTNFDITCKSRTSTLNLFSKLQKVDCFNRIRLYESNKIYVVLGWVRIPVVNGAIKRSIEQLFGEVLHITHKKCKDGLLTGVRIARMNKNVVEQNPLPSYLKIDGHEIYITYDGQTATCKYCGQAGHKQAVCEKRLKDFPVLSVTSSSQQHQRINPHNATITKSSRHARSKASGIQGNGANSQQRFDNAVSCYRSNSRA